MDGENNGTPYLEWDDLGGKPTIFWNIHLDVPGTEVGWDQRWSDHWVGYNPKE